MMSWSGGWFFLMAAEIFNVGSRDFRLPGLGSYLQIAAAQGDLSAVLWGLGTLVAIILLLDQFVWRPLLAWATSSSWRRSKAMSRLPPWFLECPGPVVAVPERFRRGLETPERAPGRYPRNAAGGTG